MAQTGYTPISIYYSATTTNVPTAGNLVAGELAINTADGKLFYKDSAGVVQVIAGKGGAGVAGGSNTQVQYNSSGSLAGSANMTFNGTTLTLANDASISGLTVGKGTNGVAGNTALGVSALNASNSGTGYNTAVGNQALLYNTSGSLNAAFGASALFANTTGASNTAIGTSSVQTNTTGSFNTAVGNQALQANTTASNNTAVGYQAGYSQAGGANGNTLIGYQAGYTGNSFVDGTPLNTMLGYQAGYSATTGIKNTLIGAGAGTSLTTGSNNSILGRFTGNNSGLDIRTASNYIVLSDGDGNPRCYWNGNGEMIQNYTTDVAAASAVFTSACATTANQYGLLITFTAAPNNGGQYMIKGSDSSATRFAIYSNGGLANYQANNSNLSDQREKKDIELAGNYLDKVCAIPVKTFLYNDQTDNELNLGVIAQDVQSIAPELVTESDWSADKDGSKMRLSIYQTDLQYALMKAIQELKAEVDSLKAQLGK